MDMYKRGLDDLDADKISYRVMGHHVCEEAFVNITGIGNWSVQHVRDMVLHGKVSSLSRRELGYGRVIQACSKEPKYLDARAWLEHYADKVCDHSPMEMMTYLPKGRASTVYALYAHERAGLPCASIAVVLDAWRFELPWLIMAPALCKCVQCGVCDC